MKQSTFQQHCLTSFKISLVLEAGGQLILYQFSKSLEEKKATAEEEVGGCIGKVIEMLNQWPLGKHDIHTGDSQHGFQKQKLWFSRVDLQNAQTGGSGMSRGSKSTISRQTEEGRTLHPHKAMTYQTQGLDKSGRYMAKNIVHCIFQCRNQEP